jgi:hypothetical protein
MARAKNPESRANSHRESFSKSTTGPASRRATQTQLDFIIAVYQYLLMWFLLPSFWTRESIVVMLCLFYHLLVGIGWKSQKTFVCSSQFLKPVGIVFRETRQMNLFTSGSNLADQILHFKSMLKTDEIWGLRYMNVVCVWKECKQFVAKSQTTKD